MEDIVAWIPNLIVIKSMKYFFLGEWLCIIRTLPILPEHQCTSIDFIYTVNFSVLIISTLRENLVLRYNDFYFKRNRLKTKRNV